jgi:hypothetical protein
MEGSELKNQITGTRFFMNINVTRKKRVPLNHFFPLIFSSFFASFFFYTGKNDNRGNYNPQKYCLFEYAPKSVKKETHKETNYQIG